MARFRLSALAEDDVRQLLSMSLERWGTDGQQRYARLLATAFMAIARNPAGPSTRDRAALVPGLRSFHLRSSREKSGVTAPVHLVYFRIAKRDVVEIVRVLHERMDPTAHLPRTRLRKP